MRAGESLVTRVGEAALTVTTTRLLRMSVSGSGRYSSAPVEACEDLQQDELAQTLDASAGLLYSTIPRSKAVQSRNGDPCMKAS